MINIKHFETLWEDSEHISEEFCKKNNINDDKVLIKLIELISQINDDSNNLNYNIGMILFYLTNITKKRNINTYICLNKIIQDISSELTEQKQVE